MMIPSTAIAARHVRLLLAAALAATSVTACRSTSGPADAAPAGPDTWAVVDGRTITRQDVEKAYLRSDQAETGLSDDESMAARLALLNDLIVQDIVIAKAPALKVEVSDTELDTAFAEARKNITDEAFQQELTRRGLTAADMRDGLRRELLSRKVLEREVGSKVAVSEQEINDYFQANRAQFNLPEDAYRLAQIVVTPGPDPQLANRTGDDATTPEAAAKKVEMLMGKLKGGASFRDLAMDYSEDPESGPRGGDLGLVPVSSLKQAPPALRNAVLNAPAGRVTVVSGDGAHTIVLVVGQESAGQRDLSMPAVRENITSRLRAQKEQLLRAAYLTAIRNEADVVNHLARRLVETQGRMPALAPEPPAAR